MFLHGDKLLMKLPKGCTDLSFTNWPHSKRVSAKRKHNAPSFRLLCNLTCSSIKIVVSLIFVVHFSVISSMQLFVPGWQKLHSYFSEYFHRQSIFSFVQFIHRSIRSQLRFKYWLSGGKNSLTLSTKRSWHVILNTLSFSLPWRAY